MKTQTDTTLYNLGKTLGRPLAWVLRKQQPLVHWLAGKGLSALWARRFLTLINLAIVVFVLFWLVPKWIMLLVAFLAVLAFTGVDIDIPETKESEWRMGIDGYGLYDNQFDLRIDGGSANDDNNPNRD